MMTNILKINLKLTNFTRQKLRNIKKIRYIGQMRLAYFSLLPFVKIK